MALRIATTQPGGSADVRANGRQVRDELDAVAGLASHLGIWAVLGSAHPLTPPHRPHNSLYVVSNQGRIVTRYDKRFCSHTEITSFYSPGFEPMVFDVDGYRFGCALCVEVDFPHLFADYERLGVDCLLLSAWPTNAILHQKAQVHAATNDTGSASRCPRSVPASCGRRSSALTARS